MSPLLRNVLLITTVGVVAATAGFGLAHWQRGRGATAPDVQATTFNLKDLAGKAHGLDEWRGKLVLLNFWATWCPPCRREIPAFIRLESRYQSQGLQIVGISVDNPEAVARYWQDMKINYPLLLADESTYDLMTAYGNTTNSLPYSVLIAPNGKIVDTKIGAYEEKELEALIQPLLPGQKSVAN